MSDFNRQILYRVSDIGQLKADASAKTLRSLNPNLNIEWESLRLDETNDAQELSDSDIIIEGGDGAAARLAFNKWSIAAGKYYIHASAQYNYSYVLCVSPHGPCLQCAYPDMEAGPGGAVPVIGTATALAGSVAANEAINHLIGRGFNSLEITEQQI